VGNQEVAELKKEVADEKDRQKQPGVKKDFAKIKAMNAKIKELEKKGNGYVLID
jgi:hypothetical protein